MTNHQFNWGESIKIKDSAPQKYSPGKIGSICGITKIDSDFLSDKYTSAKGEWIYTVEYIGGTDKEIPECFIESLTDR